MTPFLPVRHLLEYLRRRLVNHLNAREIRQAPDLLGQGAVCPLYNLLKAVGICAGHEANFTTRTDREIADIAVIARHRRHRKGKISPLMNRDDRGLGEIGVLKSSPPRPAKKMTSE